MNTIKTLVTVFIFLILFSACNMSDGGVKFYNNMDKYALEYIKKNNLLEEGEKLQAYYDYTVSLDGTEAAILTDKRVVYHNKETETSSILLKDVIDLKHTEDSLLGDIIEIYTAEGSPLVIEIAPLNDGKLFFDLLKLKVNTIEK